MLENRIGRKWRAYRAIPRVGESCRVCTLSTPSYSQSRASIGGEPTSSTSISGSQRLLQRQSLDGYSTPRVGEIFIAQTNVDGSLEKLSIWILFNNSVKVRYCVSAYFCTETECIEELDSVKIVLFLQRKKLCGW